jgi:hypothetical protein
MSDYLSRIVEQSMGIAGSVQPLIAPIFAPPSFSAFLSLEDMMQQVPAVTSEEAAETSITASQPSPEILSTLLPPASMQADASQSLQDADNDRRGRLIAPAHEQALLPPVVSGGEAPEGAINRPLRIEEILTQPEPKRARQSERPAIRPVQDEPVLSSRASSISFSPREKMMDSDGTPVPRASQAEQPRAESSLHEPAPLPKRLSAEQAERDQTTIVLVQPLAGEKFDKDAGLPIASNKYGVVEPMWGEDRRPQGFARHDEWQADGRPQGFARHDEWQADGRPQGSPPIPTSAPAPTIHEVGGRRDIVGAGVDAVVGWGPLWSPVRLPNHNDGIVQEMNATAKTSEAIIASDTAPPRKQPSHASHPLDALIQQQSALYPTPLLPGEISLAEGNSRRPSPAREVSGDLASEPDKEQRLLTETNWRNDSANEPAIRVSIGRVEVRATVAPAASVTKRAAPAAPALSLSDYLQRRKGGTG